MSKIEPKHGQGSIIKVCSPVMDLSTADVWRLFGATDFLVSEIYDKMYEAGIAIENQRTGSLLNFAATKNIASVKTLEPDMYAKINARFQNIEFMAQFGKNGYYNIGKPKDTEWNGRNHIKAGLSDEENSKNADLYEAMLIANDIEHDREGNEFTFPKDKQSLILVPDRPLEDAVKNGAPLFDDRNSDVTHEDRMEKVESGHILESLRLVHTTWRDYCLYMLNTTSEPIRSIWREKMITSIMSWKFSTGSVNESTLDALTVLTELDNDFTKKITDDFWEKEDWRTFGRLNISGKHVLSISKYPQESLEKEALMCIERIIDEQDMTMLESSDKLTELALLWNEQGGRSLTPLEAIQNYAGKKKKVVIETDPEPADIGSDKFWSNVRKGMNIWFKEDIHSTSSWKRFVVAIMKNDVTLKYLGFAPTSTERMARAKAVAAFSDKEEERKKAKADADKLAKKIEKENAANAK